MARTLPRLLPIFAALLFAVSLAPTASAHPVVVRCTGDNVDEAVVPYVNQLDPTDPNTWFSGILYLNPPGLDCSTDCAFMDRCYPMPCFYDPAVGPQHCDQAHPIEVPWPL